MCKPHKHASLIKAWADGAQIQKKVLGDFEGYWIDLESPAWNTQDVYRLRPEEPTVYSYPVLKMPSGRVIIGVSALQTLETKTPYKLEFDVLDDVPSNPRFVKV